MALLHLSYSDSAILILSIFHLYSVILSFSHALILSFFFLSYFILYSLNLSFSLCYLYPNSNFILSFSCPSFHCSLVFSFLQYLILHSVIPSFCYSLIIQIFRYFVNFSLSSFHFVILSLFQPFILHPVIHPSFILSLFHSCIPIYHTSSCHSASLPFSHSHSLILSFCHSVIFSFSRSLILSLPENGLDYLATTETLGPFINSTRRLCTDIPFIDDLVCESNPYPEDFSVSMELTMSNPNITVTPRRIGVAIDDTVEPECSE